MSEPVSFGRVELNLVASLNSRGGRPDEGTPFRVLLLGNFSGRAGRGEAVEPETLALRRPVVVDRDNLDEVLRRTAPRVRLSLAEGGPPLDIYFDSLEDFHPDRLYERLEIFRALRVTRRKLGDPSTFRDAAEEVRRWASTGEAAQDATPRQDSETPLQPDTTRDLIEQMLAAKSAPQSGEASARAGESPGEGAGPSSSESSDFARFLRAVVGPHVTADTDARAEELTRVVDEAVGSTMRAVLHHADFRALEAAWRAVRFLVYNVETGPELKFYLLDLTRDELAADLLASEDLARTALYRLLVEGSSETHGGEPWAFVAGDYTFDTTSEDAQLLGRLAKIADAAGVPFVAAAHARLAGCDSLAAAPDPEDWRHAPDAPDAEAWRALRRLPESARLGLALPRFLLRLPYGAETDPADSFDFEETQGGEPPHESYLWGNPAFALARLLAESFTRSGWDMRPGDVQQFGGLPLHVYEAGGETHTKPCAEVLLGERAARLLLERGLMPLLSFKDRDDLRLARFQSLSDPPTRLAGRWDS